MIAYPEFGKNGKLGNQMFQFAFVLARAKQFNINALLGKIDSSGPSCSTNEISQFKIEAYKDLVEWEDVKNLKYDAPMHWIKEQGFCFDPRFLIKPSKIDSAIVCYHGYFQSEKYFLKAKEEVFNCFQLKTESDLFKQKKAEILSLNKTVSIHLRFGDYLNAVNYHGCLSNTSYYADCFNSIEQNQNVLVFSDDLDKAKTHITSFIKDFSNILYIGNEFSGAESLILQSLCKTNIIANSSFSWWAGWLNQHKDKIVFAPKQWFGPTGPKDISDVYCKGWILK